MRPHTNKVFQRRLNCTLDGVKELVGDKLKMGTKIMDFVGDHDSEMRGKITFEEIKA